MRGIVLLLLLCSTSAAAFQATDLAALARKEKERRAKVVKPAKVLTEEELKEAAAKETGAVTTVTPVVRSAPASSAPATDTATDDTAREDWKRRVDTVRKAAVEAQAKLVDMQAELERFRSDLTVVPADEAQDPLRLQKRAARIGEMTRAVEAQRVAVDAAKRAVTELEEQARREGVPAGWLR